MTNGAPRLTTVEELLGPPGPGGAGGAAPFPGVAAALAARLRADGASPMVTFYDDATGERVELSGVTLDNWVAKTANLLVDTLGLGPGDRVGVDLPAHWLAVVILLAAWSAGLEVLVAPSSEDRADGGDEADGPDDDEPAGDVQAVFVAESRIDAALALGADEVVALSLRPFGARMAHPVAGVLDFAAEVPAHGDRFAAPAPPAAQTSLLARAAGAAEAAGLGPGDRLLSTAGPGGAEGLLATVLAPLVTGASVVVCRHLDTHLDDGALARRIAAERVTAVCGTSRPLPAGVRRLFLADAAAVQGHVPEAG
ncbi:MULTISPECIES: TIGR03089 family protein [unclassified Pseudofrankia]|uniref:TIGR03089 family protein n=1 Tax=unclassified Pseudofrankia TaxID=2994372 RepID=UPI0008D960AF|nr:MULTISPECIES: TIGR03089 family protein [unclassified Pseudofrankia]MDT3438422.1 TIGR03089 family protein [Pseudofrankia sp. BMG5.37]OHV45448.1 TIGR03089 family protein [Pseudofrankia sp. BMG5.36]